MSPGLRALPEGKGKGFQRRRGVSASLGPRADCERSWHASSVWAGRCEHGGSREEGWAAACKGWGGRVHRQRKGAGCRASSDIQRMALGGRQTVLPHSPWLLYGWQFSGELFPAVLTRGGEPKVLLLCHLESPPLSCPILEALWGASKLAKVACSGSRAPRFVNKDDVTAERTCSTAHVRQQVLAWAWAPVCDTPVWASP